MKTVKDVQNWLASIEEETLKKMPVWMKCNFLLNKITEHQVNVSWDKVNKILKESYIKYDFNDFKEVTSVEELAEVAANAREATVPEFNMPYYRQKCKTCSEDFTLTRKEIDYFTNNKLFVPKRCYYCRKGLEKPKMIVPTIKEVEEPTKSAFQLAFEKANITV